MVLATALAIAGTSCKRNNVKKIEVENSFALSIFNDDSIMASELIGKLDSAWSERIIVADDGSLSMLVTGDTVKNVFSGSELLNNIDDFYTEVYKTVDIPVLDIPDSLLIVRDLISLIHTGVPIPPFEYVFSYDTTVDLHNVANFSFNIDNIIINEAEMNSGLIQLDFNVDVTVDPRISFSAIMSSEEITKDGNPVEIYVDNHDVVELDMAGMSVKPAEDSIRFSAMANLNVQPVLINQNTAIEEVDDIIDMILGVSGEKNLSLVGSITNISVASVDGQVTDLNSRFRGVVDSITLSLDMLEGDLWVKTPSLRVGYTNTFGFDASAAIDMLYYVNKNYEIVNLINNNIIDITIEHTEEGEYKNVELEGLIPYIDIIDGIEGIVYSGEVMAESSQAVSVTENSHVDITTEIEMPINMKINELSYMDTIDFSMEEINITDYLQELEFKFRVNNGLPLQVALQLYTCEDTYTNQPEIFITDSLFKPDAQGIMNNVIESSFGGDPVKSTIYVTADDKMMENLFNANKLIIKVSVSTDGREVSLKTTDMIGLGIGIKTKTNEISWE